ncbi:MAG TPA: hypothetical protein VMT18_08980 [Planctomycetota bacterium]|nr:hypothetical protein [Planctomycetota bacterium]
MFTNSTPQRSALALALVAGCVLAARAPRSGEVELGEGRHAYVWSQDWSAKTAGTNLGNTHGCVLVDGRGRVLVNTDTADAVVAFSPEGERLAAFGGEDLAGGLHGMALVVEDGRELIYATHTGRGEVLALTLDGEVLWRVGWPEASGLYAGPHEYHPTSVAVAPDGRFFVADGYGKSWIHQYDAERTWVRAFGGPGSEPGKLATPHGIWIDTRGERPLLLVADRENRRIQRFDLEGAFVDVFATDLERPCHMHPWGADLAVPELAGGVAVLDAEGALVTRLGANPDPALRAQNGVARARWAAGELLAPHCATFDAAGNLYVLDWNAHGRVSKLVRAR